MTIPSGPITYIENGASLPILTGATAADPDLLPTASTTAVLKVTNTNAEATDRLQIIPGGVYSIVVPSFERME